MDPSEQGAQEPGRSLRRSLQAYALWVLTSTLGGAIGGATFITQFFGVLFLFGLVFGATQALVLVRYLPLGVAVAGAWMGVSFSGWLVGWMVRWMVAVFELEILTTLVAAPHGRLGNVVTASVVWATLAAFQGTALTLLIALTLGRRPWLLALGLLWVVAGVLGAALAGLVSPYLSNAPALAAGPSAGALYQIVPVVVAQAAAGALYGATTGLVLAMIVKRLDERRSAGEATNT